MSLVSNVTEKKVFEHNNSRDTFCILQCFSYATLLWKSPLISSKTPPSQIVPTIMKIAKEQFFYIREQDKVSFTTRLTSLILQQYKIGFKVELRNNKVIVVINGMKIAYEDVFLISRKANGANNEYGK